MKRLTLSIFIIFLAFFAGCGKKDKTVETKKDNKAGDIETVQYICDGMHCSGCEETITTEVKKLDGIFDIKADAKAKLVTVSFNNALTNKDEISKAINSAGYDTELTKSENKHSCDEEMKKSGVDEN